MTDSFLAKANSDFDADYNSDIFSEYRNKPRKKHKKKWINIPGIQLLTKIQREKKQKYSEARKILSSLNGKWDLGQRFSISGNGASSILAEGLNLVFERFELFVSGLAKDSVELGKMAPVMQHISKKVREAAENLCARSEDMETSCRTISQEMKETAHSSVEVLEKSTGIVSELARARNLTKDSLDSMTNVGTNMETLSDIISDLEISSKSIGTIIENISNLSNRTGLLSLNAFIEAARAGKSGASFAVIAKEIRQLSEQSGQAASDIRENLLNIGRMIEATVLSVTRVRESISSGLEVSAEADSALILVENEHSGFHGQIETVLNSVRGQEEAVSSLLSGIEGIAKSGRTGVAESRKLEGFAGKIKMLSDQQLESSGKFVLPQYRKVEAEIVKMAEEPAIRDYCGNTDKVLSEKIAFLPFIELIYLTDSRGVQVSANIFRDPALSEKGRGAIGRDWSSKEWFRSVRDTNRNHISDIYRSEATGSYCMTVSVPIIKDGLFKGVLGADINFEDIMEI